MSRKFIYDTSAPTAYIVKPSSTDYLGALTEVRGTASDPGTYKSDVSKTRIALQRISDAQYWDGVSMDPNGFNVTGNGTAEWLTATDTSPWFFSIANAAFENGISYRLVVKASDTVGNEQNTFTWAVSSMTFRVDKQAPSSALTTSPGTSVTTYTPTGLVANAFQGQTVDNLTAINRVELQVSYLEGTTTNY